MHTSMVDMLLIHGDLEASLSIFSHMMFMLANIENVPMQFKIFYRNHSHSPIKSRSKQKKKLAIFCQQELWWNLQQSGWNGCAQEWCSPLEPGNVRWPNFQSSSTQWSIWGVPYGDGGTPIYHPLMGFSLRNHAFLEHHPSIDGIFS